MRSTPIALAVSFAAAAIIVLATFLPWQHTPLDGEVSGFGSGGWATLVLALIAALNLGTWKATGKRRDAFAAAAVGGAAMLASAYLIYDFSTSAEGLFNTSTISDPRIGGYVALTGAIVLTASSLLLGLWSERDGRAPAAAPTTAPR